MRSNRKEKAIEPLDIIRMGHPVLRQVAEAVPRSMLGTPKLRTFAQALIDTMLVAQGVGLAAPQVAEGWRCFAYYVPAEDDEAEAEITELAPRVLINPTIQPIGQDIEIGWEGCLSIPNIRGEVPRHFALDVSALDVEGNPLRFVAEGFHARVIQHEYDHLDGILFLDRMESMKSLCFEKEWAQYVLGYDIDEDDEDIE